MPSLSINGYALRAPSVRTSVSQSTALRFVQRVTGMGADNLERRMIEGGEPAGLTTMGVATTAAVVRQPAGLTMVASPAPANPVRIRIRVPGQVRQALRAAVEVVPEAGRASEFRLRISPITGPCAAVAARWSRSWCRMQHYLRRCQCSTKTGSLLWAMIFLVWDPKMNSPMALRPWVTMTIMSQPDFSASSMIAWSIR